MTRHHNRNLNVFRPLSFHSNFTKHAEGSVLACCGDTRVLCTVSVTDGVPKFLKDQNRGWLTAEYGMLPRATHSRCDRESTRGKQTGRTIEIQRLIGRALRSCIDFRTLGDLTLVVDCDVLQADGGTRTTAINGAMVALVQAMQKLQYAKKLKHDPIKHLITACSIGIIGDTIRLDLDYSEDSQADVDANIILTEHGDIVEVQGTAEGSPFSPQQLFDMMTLAQESQASLLEAMRSCLTQDPHR
jgi:ribonuclease PH